MILSPGQPISHGQPYRYHLNGPVHMMTARKRVGPLPTHRLASYVAGPFRKRRRSPITSIPTLSPVSGALSPVRVDLISSPKRVKDSGYLTDVEVDPREISLRDDAIIRVSDEPHLEQDIDPEIQAEIDECIAYADALRDRGIDVRVWKQISDKRTKNKAKNDKTRHGMESVKRQSQIEAKSQPSQSQSQLQKSQSQS
ncbi:hypothetical protein Tco_1476856 [Tanacetum coccineum]